MDRRQFLLTSLVSGLATPLAARAQPMGKPWRVGLLRPAPPSPEVPQILAAFKAGLGEQGYREGQNLAVEFRYPRRDSDRLADIAEDLVKTTPDAILAAASSGVHAVRSATTTIPIVALDLETDPLTTGFIQSLARPGQNVTGLFLDFPELGGKWLELLKELSPKLSRVGIMWDPATGRVPLEGAVTAAPSLRLNVQVLEARGPGEFEAAFQSATRTRAGSILALSSPVFNTYRRTLVELTVKYRLPTIMPFPLFANDGGLMAYGPDLIDLYRQGGVLVGRILRGARPAEIPVERPNRFRLVVNMKTAKAIGLTIPPSLLLRADQVIE